MLRAAQNWSLLQELANTRTAVQHTFLCSQQGLAEVWYQPRGHPSLQLTLKSRSFISTVFGRWGIYSVSWPGQIKLKRDNSSTEHQNAKSKTTFHCQVLNDFPFSQRCLQGDSFFLPKQTSCPTSVLTWGISEFLAVEEGAGDNTMGITKISLSPCVCPCQPAWIIWGPCLTRWLVQLGPTPTTGSGRNFKVGAKYLRNLALVPWRKWQWWVQVSLLLLITHLGTCPASARTLYQLVVWIHGSTTAAQQTHHQAVRWAKPLLWLWGRFFGGNVYELELKNLAWAKGGEDASLSLRNAFDRHVATSLGWEKVVPFLQIERFHWSPAAVGTEVCLLITFLVLKPTSSPALTRKLKTHLNELFSGKSHVKSKPISWSCLCESWLFKDQLRLC